VAAKRGLKLRQKQTEAEKKGALDKYLNHWGYTLNATPHSRWRQLRQPAWSCYTR